MKLRILLLVAFVMSGMAALIYELTWIRPLQFLLSSSTYTISIIFGVFMLGLALGSLVMSKYADKIKNLPATYGLIELGIGIYGVVLLTIFNYLPDIYDALHFLHTNFYLFEFVQFLLVFVVLLIPTMLMGATWPIIAKFYTKEKIGKGIGEVYFANNLGAILGSFSAGFLLIPILGITKTIVLAGAVNILLGSTILLLTTKGDTKKIILVAAALFLTGAYFGEYSIIHMHEGGFYRSNPVYETLGPVVYYEEGRYATVTVRNTYEDGMALFINGKGQGGFEITDLRVNFLLAYLPLLLNPQIEDAAIIGLGTGTTAGQISQFATTTTVEIEPKIAGATDYFKIFNMNVLQNPNNTLILDDGRNWLLKNKNKFDVIIQEPADPWQSFSGAFYSKEYYEIVKEDLEEQGLFIKWIPIYEMTPEDFRSIYKTFTEAFPHNIGFSNIKPTENLPIRFQTGEILLVGSKKEIEFSEEKFTENFNALPVFAKEYMTSLRLYSGSDIYNLQLFTSEQMEGYGKDAQLLTDDKPLLEFTTAKTAINQKPTRVTNDVEQFISR